ncbi:MAG: hypothetical protein GXO83_12265 [Chlorobi bacterium]|nr:hypothetical protein [Chlorobiota bacterium]
MKKLILLILTISLSYYSIAQESEKLNEIGFTTLNLSNFGITYRIGNNKSVWRFNAIIINGGSSKSNEDNLDKSQNRFGAGFQVGKEHRKTISDKFELRYGLDLAFSYYKNNYIRVDQLNLNRDSKKKYLYYDPSINLVLGFNFVFTDKFLLGAEFLPYFSYSTRINKEYDFTTDEYKITKTQGASYGLSSESIRLSLIYRF